jgi:hypothetical protein
MPPTVAIIDGQSAKAAQKGRIGDVPDRNGRSSQRARNRIREPVSLTYSPGSEGGKANRLGPAQEGTSSPVRLFRTGG